VSPRPSRAAERRPEILAAAARVIAARGLDGTRLSDVAAEAGVSVGTIQHYFRTRHRLLAATFAFEADRAVDRWVAAGDGGADGWNQLLALIETVLHRPTFRERWTRWLEFFAAAARDPAMRGEFPELYEQWRAPFRRAIEAGVETGAFRLRHDVEDVVDRSVALFDGLALQVLLDAPGMSLDRMRDLLVVGLADELDLAPRRAESPQRRQKGRRRARAASIPSRPRAGSSGT
jgi:AcrR family transcriptional regulator